MSPLTESQFQRQVTELAELYGWEWMHPRAGRTMDSWRTPMSGTMAQGWPDLVLVHPAQRRILFVELKTDMGKLTSHQERVMDVLREVETFPHQKWVGTGRSGETEVTFYVWRPINWPLIEATLKRQEDRAA
jgi:hypothetical protein